MLTPRQTITTVFGGLILGSLTYFGYGYATAERRVRALCAEISPNMTVESLQTFAASHGLKNPPLQSGRNYLVESRTFGRYGCLVEIESGLVKRSAFSFAD